MNTQQYQSGGICEGEGERVFIIEWAWDASTASLFPLKKDVRQNLSIC